MSVIAPTRAAARPEPVRWTRERFYAAVDAGVIGEDEKLEMIGGIITDEGMEDRRAQKSGHSVAVLEISAVLGRAFGSAHHVRPQMPLAIGPDSDPEPDITVVGGVIRDYAGRHPARAELVIEVAESSLRFDRTTKASLYASAGVPDYWIVNLVDRVLDVHRQPVPDRDEMFGWRYASIARLAPGDAVAPVRAPDASIPVADLLP